MELAEWIDRQRNSLPRTQRIEAFADKIGAHWVTVYGWMRGDRRIKHAAHMQAITKATRGKVTAEDMARTWERHHRRSSTRATVRAIYNAASRQ